MATMIPSRGRVVYRNNQDPNAQRFLCRTCQTCIAFWRGTMLLDMETRKIILPNTTTNLMVTYPQRIRTSGNCKWLEMHCYGCKSFMGLMNIEAEPRSYFLTEGRIELFLEALMFSTGFATIEAVELLLPQTPF